MKCGVCGNFTSISAMPYQRIRRDKQTGHWVPSPGICQCDPDDIGLWGLIERKEKEDAKRRKKETRV